ncbi:hypothetical protein BT67DRAFT_496644 [Trichocladium antarcticum]|uniref:Kelch repeat-containing protein n=1 Tax=Trichocladium antarcticum TaxID=1450529 RepID=A0AAN6UL19_9PEZI|nr:hypothetical protein BT67DRAFT_496644 [Trichocladium antarcticum]
MAGPSLGVLLVLTALASHAVGQAQWGPNQVNTRICQWKQLRATVVRDTVYLDGGNLFWQPGLADGVAARPEDDGNPLGLIYTLNFSTPFNTTQNISAVLGTLSKPGGTNIAPTYLDGALLGNNEEFFLFGGLLRHSDSFSDPSEKSVLGYQRYQYGPVRKDFQPNFLNRDVPPNITYVAYGGAASAPSENLAWYFSGLRSASGGPVYTLASNMKTQAVNVSSTLVTLDMTTQQQETFTNNTLPDHIQGRANPELVWVPVGPRGILVALGGVVEPDFVNFLGSSFNESTSKAQSPSFMTTIDIYDVASGKWYNQTTVGGPGQLTRGCAVVAPAQDGSSFNIYYYGGYDGLRQKQAEAFNDNVWVLSLPSFAWVKLSNSTAEGRAGHKCVMPYPDQMLVIGGYQSQGGFASVCLRETIRVFNMSTGTWLDRYDPAIYSNYTVPAAVIKEIGGSGTGGATATTPSPSWDSRELQSVFASPYPTSKIKKYYPYSSAVPVDNTNPNAAAPTPTPDEGGGGGVPAYLPPVLGSVLGLVFVTMVAVLVLLWRRRRLLRRGMSEAGTEDTNGHRITSWLRGQPSEVKALTVTTSSEYSPPSAADAESVRMTPPRTIAEMMNTEIQIPHEMPDTSPRVPPVELHDNNAASHRGSLNSGTFYTSGGTQQTDHASISQQFQPLPCPPPIPDDESPIYYRPDSDALGPGPLPTSSSTTTSPASATTTSTPAAAAAAAGPPPPRDNKVLSGISNLSDSDRSHLRQISDGTVSSMTTAPLAGLAAVPGSPLRRSVFREEDMGGDGGG